MCRVILLTAYAHLVANQLRQLSTSLHVYIVLTTNRYGRSFMNPSTSIRYRIPSATYSMKSLSLAYSISDIFYEILVFGLYQGHQAPMDLMFHHLPHDLFKLYHRQESLGWKQLYYEYLMPLWIHLLGHYHPQINGWTYFTKVIMLRCYTHKFSCMRGFCTNSPHKFRCIGKSLQLFHFNAIHALNEIYNQSMTQLISTMQALPACFVKW